MRRLCLSDSDAGYIRRFSRVGVKQIHIILILVLFLALLVATTTTSDAQDSIKELEKKLRILKENKKNEEKNNRIRLENNIIINKINSIKINLDEIQNILNEVKIQYRKSHNFKEKTIKSPDKKHGKAFTLLDGKWLGKGVLFFSADAYSGCVNIVEFDVDIKGRNIEGAVRNKAKGGAVSGEVISKGQVNEIVGKIVMAGGWGDNQSSLVGAFKNGKIHGEIEAIGFCMWTMNMTKVR